MHLKQSCFLWVFMNILLHWLIKIFLAYFKDLLCLKYTLNIQSRKTIILLGPHLMYYFRWKPKRVLGVDLLTGSKCLDKKNVYCIFCFCFCQNESYWADLSFAQTAHLLCVFLFCCCWNSLKSKENGAATNSSQNFFSPQSKSMFHLVAERKAPVILMEENAIWNQIKIKKI